MSTEQFHREKTYVAALAIAKALLKSGIIDETDYRQIDTILREKYRPLLGSLLC